MGNRSCELLLEYIESLLHRSGPLSLDVGELEEPWRRLGLELLHLGRFMEELGVYSRMLSEGNLSVQVPAMDGFLPDALKTLHENLKHLVWQANQVAAGDYSQMSCLGEFSDAFNTMTAQLREREMLLLEEKEQAKKRVEVIEGYNALLTELTRKRKEWILVVDADDRKIIYCNKWLDEDFRGEEFCGVCDDRLDIREKIIFWKGTESYKVWEQEDDRHRFYQITTFFIEWKGNGAYGNIIRDITDEKRTVRSLTDKAYTDPGTGICNRMFFEEHMRSVLWEKRDITMCYMDLDGLKYVNDRFGHNEGDHYLREFVGLMQRSFRSSDVFVRLGGDEFCILLEGLRAELVERKVRLALEEFRGGAEEKYPRSFSYGIVEINGKENRMELPEIVRMADACMYECKRRNKAARGMQSGSAT